MKMRMLKPLAAVLAAGFLYGCAGSSETMDSTAMEETSTMSETQTMAGDDATTETEVTTDVTARTEMDANMEPGSMTIVDAANAKSEISTFMGLLETAGITAALQGQGEYTIFAPTNEAFKQLPVGQLDYLKKPENKAELIKVLQPHLFGAKVASSQLQNNQRIQIAENDFIDVTVGTTANDISIGGARIVESDIEASNGVIHVVDRVLVTADRVKDND